MQSSTLTSLAMLKVTIDHGGDYLNYLRPFIFQVLTDHRSQNVADSGVTDSGVRELIRTDFGLDIPEKTIQMVLKSIVRRSFLVKEHGRYRISGDLPDPGLSAKKSDAGRHIQAVLSGLVRFSRSTPKPLTDDDHAEKALHKFLVEFDIPCLRAYVYATVIPNIDEKHGTDIVLVSKYFLHLEKNDPERHRSFMIMVQGHMLANALLCPDLYNAPKFFKGTTFYFDTPLLLRWLGLEGEQKKNAADDLCRLLRDLGATVAVFSHTHEELEQVITNTAARIDSPDGYGPIVMEARRRNTTPSDLLLLVGRVGGKLKEAGIAMKKTPQYDPKFQIDETKFEQALEDERVFYNNPYALRDDINSVRSIYALRKGRTSNMLEKSIAVLVTSNVKLAQAAFGYMQKNEYLGKVSSIITDFSLANIAWLKAPLGAKNLPYTRAISFAYAALQPTPILLKRYLQEINKLENDGTITERDHQILRSHVAEDKFMHLTLGDEKAFTRETIMETLERVTNEITEKAAEEHRETQKQLEHEHTEKIKIQERLYWHLNGMAKRRSWIISGLIVIFLVVGLLISIFKLQASMPILSIVFACGTVVFSILSFLNLTWGFTVENLHKKIYSCYFTRLLKREKKAMGLESKTLNS